MCGPHNKMVNEEQQLLADLTASIEGVLERGAVAALATLIDGSQKVGSKLLITDAGEIAGSLGDRLLDIAVVEVAPRFLAMCDEARPFCVIDFAPQLDQWTEAKILFERIEPELRIVICGAGHVGASLARLASVTGYQETLIDDRAEFVRRERFPESNIELIAVDDWADAVRKAIGNGRGVSVAVVTRGHNEDEECLRAITLTNPDYIGLIGSKRRTNIVLDRLRASGAPEEQLKKVYAPIGLDIGAVTPEEVALSILGEIIAERRAGKGGSLSAWRRA